MESVAGVAIATQIGMDGGLTLTGMLLRLQHHIGGTLAKVQSGTCLVERTAMVLVENHQRIEAIEMEHRQGLGTSSHHDIGLARLQHLCPKNQGVGSRRTGRRDGGDLAETAEVVGYLTGVVATTVITQTRQMFVGGAQISEMALCDVHTGHRCA